MSDAQPDIEIEIDSLLPHADNMMLLEKLVSVSDVHLEADIIVDATVLHDRHGTVPALVALEYMAQAVSAWAGAQGRKQGREPQLGFLLGTRRFITNAAVFRPGDALRVRVDCVHQEPSGLGSFDCRVWNDRVDSTARLSVFQPEDAEKYLKENSI